MLNFLRINMQTFSTIRNGNIEVLCNVSSNETRQNAQKTILVILLCIPNKIFLDTSVLYNIYNLICLRKVLIYQSLHNVCFYNQY